MVTQSRCMVFVLSVCLFAVGCSDDDGDRTDIGPSPDGTVGDITTADQLPPSDAAGTDGVSADSAPVDSAASGDTVKKAFGETCTDNADCESGLCHAFGDGTKACTLSCSSDADCPTGSQGKKCNNQNVCRV